MCKSAAEGGKRCEYADTVANVRRKARYKHRESYDTNRLAEKDVEKWKSENAELVRAHLPVTQPFQATANKKPVPEELLKLLTPKARIPVTGFSEKERVKHTEKLYNEFIEWTADLNDDEENVVRSYAMNFYQGVNSYLRKNGFSHWVKNDTYSEKEAMIERIKKNISELDSALDKAPIPEEPRKLYRFFKVPAGVTPKQYIEKYFHNGEAFKDKGYMSTTADPEFMMGHMYDRNKGEKNHRFIVMEIISRQGASLQSRSTSTTGDIQSLEKEILLPRNTKLRIINSHRSHKFELADDRRDLDYQYVNKYSGGERGHFERWGKFKKGYSMNLPLIQLIDEKLITET
jgi:hypothetical protein